MDRAFDNNYSFAISNNLTCGGRVVAYVPTGCEELVTTLIVVIIFMCDFGAGR